MKSNSLIITFLSLTLSMFSHSRGAQDIALEVESVKVEYYSSSDRGLVYVYGCSQCKSTKYYKFEQKPIIKKQGKIIPFEVFLKEYRDAKEPTVFLNKQTHSVLRINY